MGAKRAIAGEVMETGDDDDDDLGFRAGAATRTLYGAHLETGVSI